MKKLNRVLQKELTQIEQLLDPYQTSPDEELVVTLHRVIQQFEQSMDTVDTLLAATNPERNFFSKEKLQSQCDELVKMDVYGSRNAIANNSSNPDDE